MSVYFWGIVWMLVASLVAGVTVLLVQRSVPAQKREPSNDVAGMMFSIMGVLYGIVLAFIVIAVWDQVGTAREANDRESSALVNVYWYAQTLPQPEQDNVKSLVRGYTETVIDQDWKDMAAQRKVSDTGWTQLHDLQKAVSQSAPEDDSDARAQALADVRDVYDARQQRIGDAKRGISPVLWLVLIFGGLLSIGLAYLFGVSGTIQHLTMVVALTAMITLLLFSVYQMEFPYSRGVNLQPDSFKIALQRFS